MNTPTHIMLDLETLGTAPGSVILSIGACVFDENGPLDGCANRYHLNIDAERTVYAGFRMDTSTALWWMKQGDAARGALLAGQKDAVGPHVALVHFCEWLKRVAPDDKARFIWGKGPSFDCGLLAAAYRLMGLPTPWRYPNERCVRTVAAMRPDIAEPVREGVHHSALDDALHQARHVGAVMRAMGELRQGLHDCRHSDAIKGENVAKLEAENAILCAALEEIESLSSVCEDEAAFIARRALNSIPAPSGASVVKPESDSAR